MARDDEAGTGTDKGTHQAVQGDVAARAEAGLLRGRSASLASRVACRKDDEVGV